MTTHTCMYSVSALFDSASNFCVFWNKSYRRYPLRCTGLGDPPTPTHPPHRRRFGGCPPYQQILHPPLVSVLYFYNLLLCHVYYICIIQTNYTWINMTHLLFFQTQLITLLSPERNYVKDHALSMLSAPVIHVIEIMVMIWRKIIKKVSLAFFRIMSSF